jgi:hypothetical protein
MLDFVQPAIPGRRRLGRRRQTRLDKPQPGVGTLTQRHGRLIGTAAARVESVWRPPLDRPGRQEAARVVHRRGAVREGALCCARTGLRNGAPGRVFQRGGVAAGRLFPRRFQADFRGSKSR